MFRQRERQDQQRCIKLTQSPVQNLKYKLVEHDIKTGLLAFFKKQTYHKVKFLKMFRYNCNEDFIL